VKRNMLRTRRINPRRGTTLADRGGCPAEVRKMDPTWDSFVEIVAKICEKVITMNGTEIPTIFSISSTFFPKFPQKVPHEGRGTNSVLYLCDPYEFEKYPD